MRVITIKKRLINNIVNVGYRISLIFPKLILDIVWTILDSSESKLALLFRLVYLKKYSKKVDGIVYIGKSTNLKNINNLSLGANVSIHSYTYIDAYGGIAIGDNVSIANHCTLISSDHTWNDTEIPIKYNRIVPKPILIKSDVWIASGCRILGDIVINKRTVVGAGAVVTKSLESNSLYIGVPAKKFKELN